MKENKYLYHVDCVRALACVLVCLIHSPYSSELSNGIWMAGATLLGLPCNGLFFMISGYLLLPLKIDTNSFLKRRVTKVILPTLFWTLFYVFLNIFLGVTTLDSLPHILCSIPFSRQGTGWLWFMYVMIGLYLVAPLLSDWVKGVSKREFQFYLVLWLVTCLYPVLDNYVEIMSGVENMLYYFCGYIGYFLLGAYLKKYPPRLPFGVILCLYVLPQTIAIVGKIFDSNILLQQFGDYLSVFTVSMCLGLYCMLERMDYSNHTKLSKVISDFSRCSFGIYLIHHFVNHQIINRQWLVEQFGSPLQIIITTILTIVIAYTIIHSISYLPYSEFVIGYHKKI